MGTVDTRKKIVASGQLIKVIQRHRKKGRVIAFTNGCFDIIHYGHIRYLEKAKGSNRILIVGLNSDSSVRKIKGTGRPICSQKMRAAVLAALSCVDYVTLFSQETPEKLIRSLRPDVLIKGADWKGRPVAGGDFTRENGGRVEFVRFEPGFSTSRLIQKICRSGKKT